MRTCRNHCRAISGVACALAWFLEKRAWDDILVRIVGKGQKYMYGSPPVLGHGRAIVGNAPGTERELRRIVDRCRAGARRNIPPGLVRRCIDLLSSRARQTLSSSLGPSGLLVALFRRAAPRCHPFPSNRSGVLRDRIQCAGAAAALR